MASRRRATTKQPAFSITPAQVFAHLRKVNRFYICADKHKRLWATNTYWMVRVDAEHPIAKLLAEYNLPLEPMSCVVSARAITRRTDEAPVVDAIVKAPKVATEVTPHHLAGKRLFIEYDGIAAEVWERHNGGVTTVNREFVAFVEKATPGDAWVQDAESSLKPVLRYSGQTLVALLMPVRAGVDVLSNVLREAVAA